MAALPDLLQPAGTCFLVSGHAIAPEPLHDDFKPMQGHGRKRMVQTYAPRIVDVSLILESDEAAVYDDWFENALIVGNGEFTARVSRLGEAVHQYWAARWVGPLQWQAMHKGRWRMSGQLLLTGQGSDVPPQSGALAIEFEVGLTGSAALVSGVELAIEYVVALIGQNALTVEYLVELLAIEPASYFERESGGGFVQREDGTNLRRE